MSLTGKKYSRSVEIQGDEEIVTIQFKIPKDNPIYIIPQDPIAWARAVPTRTHGMWDSQKKLKLYLSLLIQKCHGDRPLYEGPLLLDIFFYFPLTQKMLKDPKKWEGTPYEFRPDYDNCSKLISDTCNDVLYEDDKTTCMAFIHKFYSSNPRTEFRFVELK